MMATIDINKTDPVTDPVTMASIEKYTSYEGMPRVGKKKSEGGDGFNTRSQMRDMSALLADMTVYGANDLEIAHAIRHSLVIMNAEKHNLNWKQSEVDNDIQGLRKKYQGAFAYYRDPKNTKANN